VGRERQPGSATSTAARAWPVAYFSAMSLILLALVSNAQKRLLPQGLANHVGHNSEVLVLGILLVAAILSRRHTPPMPTAWLIVVAIGLGLLGLLVLYAPAPGTVKTLNEPLFAGAALWIYVLRRRRLLVAAAWSVSLLVVVVIGYQTTVVTMQAESVAALMLAPVSLSLTDRRLLDPSAPDRPALRWSMICFLLLTPVLLDVLKRATHPSGMWVEILRYPSRGAEGFWGLALAQLYFVVARRLSERSSLKEPASAVPAEPAHRF